VQPPEQEPEVVEWIPPAQTQFTLSPAWIVDVLFALEASVNWLLLMVTVRVAACAALSRSATARNANERREKRKDRIMGKRIAASLAL
jgi:hypothetical protein